MLINVSVLLSIWIITAVKQRYERRHSIRTPFKIITPVFVAATEEIFTRIGTLFLDSLHGTQFVVVFIHFADAISKFQKITRQMLCDKCSKNDVTLIPQNVDVLWRGKC
jgi:hypothetical protein